MHMLIWWRLVVLSHLCPKLRPSSMLGITIAYLASV